jgi:aminodeoxyfutalosine deaminase
MPGTDIQAFVAALPKVELHVHLVGSARVDTVIELAREHPEDGVPTDRESLSAWYRFTDFMHFARAYGHINRLVRTGTDVTMLVSGLARNLASTNVRYAEVTITPLSHLANGIKPDELAEALTNGRRLAAVEHGVELAWVFDISSDLGARAGMDTIAWVLAYEPTGTVGLGLGGPEAGGSRSAFKPAFDAAIAAGLHSVPHAGETSGPESIWSAVRDLRAERIGHGIHSIEDPVLLDYLAEDALPLEVCPTSNARTRAVGSLPDHPLPRLLGAGVPVTLATDNPGIFDTDLNHEYCLCHDALGLSRSQLVDIAVTGIRAAFCSAGLARRLLAEIDQLALPFRDEGVEVEVDRHQADH